MRKRLALAMLTATLMLGSGGALFASFERHYTVYYNCIISPPSHEVVGEWDVDCDGNWTGWGWEVGSGCTEYTVTFGAYCGPDHQNLSTSSPSLYPSTSIPSPRLGSTHTRPSLAIRVWEDGGPQVPAG
jgi:hypothetical protein